MLWVRSCEVVNGVCVLSLDSLIDVVAMVRAEQLTLMRFAIFLSSVDRNMVICC